MQTPAIIHLDVDAFFASVEQRDDPALRGRPVAVGTGVVASCSYEAKRRGVRTAMSLLHARRVCPELLVVPGDYRRYESAGKRILGICHEKVVRVEVAALDDLYLAPPRTHALVDAARLAEQLRLKVREETGLLVSAGIGRGRFVASVATHAAKDRRVEHLRSLNRLPSELPLSPLVVAPQGNEAEFLAPFAAGLLPGAGSMRGARLAELGLTRLGDVAAAPRHVLAGLFGDMGARWHDLSRGIDHSTLRIDKPPLTISRRSSFDPPTADMPFLHGMLDYLLARAALEARGRNLRAGVARLHLRYGDFSAADTSCRFDPPIDDDAVLGAALRDALGRLYTRRMPLRLVAVELGRLGAAPAQPDLFPDPASERRRRLLESTDAIRERFGFRAVRPGTTLVLDQHLDHDRDGYRLRTPCLTR